MTDTLILDTPDDIQVSTARPSRGWRRMREIRNSDLAETEAMAAGLLDGLGRPATQQDAVLAEKIAALSIRERRLRRGGKAKEAQDVTRLLLRAMALLRGRGVNMPAGDPVAAMNEYLAGFADQDEDAEEDVEA
jgi:hypothetical protein